MKKVLHTVQVPRRFALDAWGGTETFIAETSKRLISRGHSSTIFTTSALAEQKSETYETIPIRRFSYFYPYIGLSDGQKKQLDRKAGNLFSLQLLKALMREPDIDIIHLHTGKRLGGIGRHAARRRGIPYVISLHGGMYAVPDDEQANWTDPLKGTLEWGKILGMLVGSRRVLEDAAAVICVGYEEYEEVSRRFPGKEVVYFPNGVDVERFSQGNGKAFRALHEISEDAVLLLTVARIDSQKNQAALIRSLPNIRSAIPDAHVVLIGSITGASYYQDLLQQIQSLGLSSSVTIVPGISYAGEELVNAYHAADIFVLPSLHEPFGMAVLEAWAAGLPVIASERGGLSRLIAHEKTGILIDPAAADDEDLTQRIIQLSKNRELRAELGKAGKEEAARRYSWDIITENLISLYRKAYEHTVS